MGYARKSLQLLGGGFSCLPPVDKVPITDYLLAQNWRTDSLGRLVSRAGYPNLFAIAGAGIAHSAASAGGASSPLYVACNSAIASPSSAVYYDADSTPIASGFDGNRVAFAFDNGYAYVMNRGNQGRHSAAGGWEAWNLSAPPASPTSAGGSGPSTTGSAVYAYTFQGVPSFVHTLTIAGVTYSLQEGMYPDATTDALIAEVLAEIAQTDPNASCTYVSGNTFTITPIVPNTLIPVSGSDGNSPENLATGGVTSLPNGSYQYYFTFMSADLTLESNPSPASLVVTVAAQAIDVTIPGGDAPTDARVGFVNIYRTGGTLAQAYRVGSIASTVASPATDFVDSMPDLQATQNGQTMSTTNGAPPACSGMIGPFLSRLYAWSTAANPNRLFYTPQNLPQYWNTDPQAGDWVDVGPDGEAIVWCSIHSNLLVVYKERSIWLLIGDPLTGTLEQIYDGIGLANAFGLAPAGLIDYFVGPNGLYLNDMSEVHEITANVRPLFNESVTNAGPLTAPGSILPGSAFNSDSLSGYAIALGHAMGRLYIAYAEQGGGYNMLVQDEGPEPETQAFILRRPGRWFYHRNAIPNTIGGFFGFFFDGTNMIGLTGDVAGAAQGFSIADFRGFLANDEHAPVMPTVPVTPVECVYQSHYEDCGLPDNDKMFLEVAVDFEFREGTTAYTADVYAGFANGAVAPVLLGTLAAGARSTVGFSLAGVGADASYEGVLARNVSVLVDVGATGVAILHNVFIYYYVESRLALAASSLPSDLGLGKVKEAKELELDIDMTFGSTLTATILSDLPGNALSTVYSNAVVSTTAGRAILKFPFATAQGLLWKVSLAANLGAPFRLYAARLLMRAIGVYVEGYESAAGFLWDSMQQALGDGEASTLDEVRFEMETLGTGPVSVEIFTDLPANVPVSQGVYALAGIAGTTIAASIAAGARTVTPASMTGIVVGTRLAVANADGSHSEVVVVTAVAATTFSAVFATSKTGPGILVTGVALARAWVAVPLADGVEARSVRLQVTGNTGYRLYRAQVRHGRIGRYLAGATPSGADDGFNTLEFDYRSERRNMFKRIEFDLRADGTVNVSVITDQDGAALAALYTPTLATPNGRTAVLVPLPPGIRGRLLRIALTSAAAARVYGVRVLTRPVGAPGGAWEWKDFPLEGSDVLPKWMDLIVEETPPVWQLADLDFQVAE